MIPFDKSSYIRLLRPPDVVVGALRFCRDSVFLLLLFFILQLYLQARWTELNQNRSYIRKWVRFENACPKFGVSPPAKNPGTQKPPFSTTFHLTAILTAYIFGTKRAYIIEQVRWKLHRLKTTWTLVHKRLKIWPEFLPTLRKFYIVLHCQALHTEISKRNSTKLCQTVGSKSR